MCRRGDGLGWPALGSIGRTAVAHGDAGVRGSDRIGRGGGGIFGVAGDFVSQRGGGGRVFDDGTILGDADGILAAGGRGSRYRGDQFVRESWRIRRALCDRMDAEINWWLPR